MAPITNLQPEELQRRIVAARKLRNMSQSTLDEHFAKDGLPKLDAGRLERGELTINRVRLDALIRHLRVPEAWFTSSDVDSLVNWTPEPVIGDPATRQAYEHLQAQLAAVAAQTAREPGRSPGSTDGQDHQGQAGEGGTR